MDAILRYFGGVKKIVLIYIPSAISIIASIITIFSLIYNKNEINLFILDQTCIENNESNQKYSIKALLKNESSKNLNLNDYDTSEFGVEISNGILYSASVLTAKPSELSIIAKNNLKQKQNKIFFGKLILDKNNYIYYQFIVVTKKKTNPEITFFGKISGINKLNIIDAENTNFSLFASKISEIKFGSLETHVIRYAFYLLLTLIIYLILALIFILVMGIIYALLCAKRFNFIKEIIDRVVGLVKPWYTDRIFDFYIEGGVFGLIKVKRIIENQDELYKRTMKYLSDMSACGLEGWWPHSKTIKKIDIEKSWIRSDNYPISFIYERGLIKIENDKAYINCSFATMLNNVINEIQNPSKMNRRDYDIKNS